MTPRAKTAVRVALFVLAVALATWQRARAVADLPPDFDERPYLKVGFDYAERMAPGRWDEIPGVAENREHPPLVKLAYGAAIKATGPTEPDWERLRMAEPMPERARPAFETGRWTSAVFGIAQVAIAAAIHPLAGLLLAIESYHSKYTSQAYLEAIPGLLFVLALLLFERGTRAPDGSPRLPVDMRLVGAAFALLGAAAAGKYPYGVVGLLALAPLTILALPRRPLVWLALAGASMVAFFLCDPYLWPDPFGRLADTIRFHFAYGQSEKVTSAGLPWYQQVVALLEAQPTKWHPGVFPLGHVTVALLPLALIGAPIAARRLPVWALTALVGLAFLLVWPTKWPQYLLLVLVPLAIVAAHAPAAVIALFRRWRGSR